MKNRKIVCNHYKTVLISTILLIVWAGIAGAQQVFDYDTDNDIDGKDLADLAIYMNDNQANIEDLAEFSAYFGCINCGQPVETILYSEADAFANEFIPYFDRYRSVPAAHHNGGFGGVSVRNSGNGYGANGYCRFDLNSITSESIVSATFKIYHPRTFNGTWVLRRVDDDTWNEAMTHFGEKPESGDIIASIPIVQGWNEFDVTDFAKEQADGKISFEITLSEVQYDPTYFISREGRKDWRPQLAITHTGPGTETATTPPAETTSTLPENSIWLVHNGIWTQYNDAQDAADLAGPGDEIIFGPGTHYQAFNIRNGGTLENPIIIRGDGKPRPVLDASGLTSIAGGSRGVIGIYAKNIIIENLEIKDASRVCGHEINASSIYPVYDSGNITVRDCYFHHNGNGVFVTRLCENYTQEYCEIAYNSYYGNGYHHGHYLNGAGTTIVRFNHIHSNGGQGYKDRSADIIFAYNYVHDNYNYEVDFMEEDHGVPQNALLIGNIIKKYPHAENYSKVIGFGQNRHGGVCTLINNTILTTDYRTAIIQLWDRDETGMDRIEMYNNILYGTDITNLSILRGDETRLTGSHNWIPTGSSDIGLLTDSIQGSTPGIIDIDAENYRLIPGSECINAGTISAPELPTHEYSHPADSTIRPDDTNGFDIGAYEYTP